MNCPHSTVPGRWCPDCTDRESDAWERRVEELRNDLQETIEFTGQHPLMELELFIATMIGTASQDAKLAAIDNLVAQFEKWAEQEYRK